MKSRWLAAAALLSVASAACTNFFKADSGPSNVTVEKLGGSWVSVASATELTDTCTKFTWTVTQIAGDTATGTFTATCQVNVVITGTATGTLSDKKLTWSAAATANVPDFPNCEITLSGNAQF